jgi:hypothetical protein
MRSTKQEVLEMVQELPEDTTLEAIISRLHFKMQVLRGLDDIQQGRTVTQEEVEEEFGQWPESSGRK